MIQCLQDADSTLIGSTARGVFLHSSPGEFTIAPYLPIDDSTYGAPNTIFTKDPLDMIDNMEFNDVPLILGSNKDEGLTFFPKFLPANPAEYIRNNQNTTITKLLLGK